MEGVKQGFETAHKDLRGGVDAFKGMPQALCDGYIMVLASSLCLVVLKPVRGNVPLSHIKYTHSAFIAQKRQKKAPYLRIPIPFENKRILSFF